MTIVGWVPSVSLELSQIFERSISPSHFEVFRSGLSRLVASVTPLQGLRQELASLAA